MAGINKVLGQIKTLFGAIRLPAEERTMNQRIALSSSYSVVQFAIDAGLRVVSTVIMSRLLDPAAFGVFAVVMMFLFILNTLTDVGFRPIALSHEEDLSHDLIQTIWTAQIIRSAILFFVILGVGAGVGVLQTWDMFGTDSAYSYPELPSMIMAMSSLFIAQAITSPNMLLYEARVSYERIFFFSVSFSVINLFVMLLTVYVTGDVWGLVWGSVAMQLLRALGVRLVFKGAKFQWRLSKNDFWMFVDRGKWLLSSTIFSSLAEIADKVMLGLFMTDVQFGVYYIANQISRFVPSFILMFARRFGIQLFRHLHKLPVAELQASYYQYRLIIDGLALCTCGMLFMLAPLLVDILYEDRYSDVASYLQVLAFASIFSGPLALRQALIAERRFKMTTVAAILRMLTVWIGLAVALLVFDSLLAALWVIALQQGPVAFYYSILGYRNGWISVPRELRTTPFLLAGAALGWAIDFAFRSVF